MADRAGIAQPFSGAPRRETRAAMDNKAFRFDDRIWDAHNPPNGFNCRCMVKALTEEDLKEQKLQVSKSDGNRMRRRRKSERTKAPGK